MLGARLFFATPVLMAVDASTSYSKVNLSSFDRGQLQIYATYDSKNVVGDPYPSYEYSGHILKLANNRWKMFYGGMCYNESNKNSCEILENRNKFFVNDTIRSASSIDGFHWDMTGKPAIQNGKFEGVTGDNYDHYGRMDPTIIYYNNKYYMYYQVEVRSQFNKYCPPKPPTSRKPDEYNQCDRIMVATSPDMITWTKVTTGPNPGKTAFINLQPNDMMVTPKAMVVDGVIYMYFGHYKDRYDRWQGFKLVKSTNPLEFDMSKAVRIEGLGISKLTQLNQHALLWPNDPNRRIFVTLADNRLLSPDIKKYVPTILFSVDGVHWRWSDDDVPVSFPDNVQNINNSMCNIATEINGGLNPNQGSPGVIDTTYYCAVAGNGWEQIKGSNFSAGRIRFLLAGVAPSPPPDFGKMPPMLIMTPTLVPPTATLTPGKLGDANGDMKVDILDFAMWKSEYLGQKNTKTTDFSGDGKVNILDFAVWKTEYLKNR